VREFGQQVKQRLGAWVARGVGHPIAARLRQGRRSLGARVGSWPWDWFGLALGLALGGGWFALEQRVPLTTVSEPEALPRWSGRFENDSWAVQLGLRQQALRAQVPTVDRVVLVPDTDTLLAAIAQWDGRGRWPVLLADNRYTDLFVARFRPAEAIVLDATALGGDRRAAAETAIAAAWGTERDRLRQRWDQLGWLPPGLVLADADDPAFGAAVALAAGRGQILVELDGDFGAPGDKLAPEQWEHLQQQVNRAAATSGYAWEQLGDAIDAVTLVGDLAAKYSAPDVQGALSVTDGLGRVSGRRWAVTGWIFGSPERAVYQAMCSLFLDPQTALLYDSYQSEPPWNNYDLTGAARRLAAIDIRSQAIARPEASRQVWRQLTRRPWRYDVAFVNSRGRADRFEAGNGVLATDDLPELAHPIAIHFLHSWSATNPDDPETIAGRWLERGAYFYYGSVSEPFLSAFVPPSAIARRLALGAPFGAAARYTNASPWKLTTIGDPLLVLLPAPPRVSPDEAPELRDLDK